MKKFKGKLVINSFLFALIFDALIDNDLQVTQKDMPETKTYH